MISAEALAFPGFSLASHLSLGQYRGGRRTSAAQERRSERGKSYSFRLV